MQIVNAPVHNAVSKIVLGGRFGEEERDLSWARLDRFAEAGGEFVETAHSYADGQAESTIGKWLSANPSSLKVITKVGHPDIHGKLELNARSIRAEAELSRRRIGEDNLHAVMLHRDDPSVPVEALGLSLISLVRDLGIPRIGVANWTAERLDGLSVTLMQETVTPLASYQKSLAVPAAPLWPGTMHAEKGVLEVVNRHGLTLIAWAAQARGYFAGQTELPSDTEPDPFDTPANIARRARCVEVGKTLGLAPETVALAWLLSHDLLAIIGPRSLRELNLSLAAAQVQLGNETIRWLDGFDED